MIRARVHLKRVKLKGSKKNKKHVLLFRSTIRICKFATYIEMYK